MKIQSLLLSFVLINSLLGQTTISGSINHDGGVRTYQLYVPSSYQQGTPVPLVFNLHGYGSNNSQQMLYGDFRSIADTANFLIVAPQGLNDVNNTAHWNAEWGTGVDDVGFLSALIDSLALDYSIDFDRVYSTGMSNGGFMSFTLAGELSNRIAAVASVTGTMSVLQIPNNTVNRPMPIMQIHGTADPTVNYNGDQYFLSVDSVLNYWASHNNCNTVPVITSVPDVNTSDGCTAEKYLYDGGDSGAEVVHYKITGGAHTWPGSAFVIGTTNQDFDASVEIWKFFSKYTLSQFTSVSENKEVPFLALMSENPVVDWLSINVMTSEQYQFKIYNLEGKLMQSNSGSNSIHLNITDFESGIYFIEVFTSSKRQVIKVIKE